MSRENIKAVMRDLDSIILRWKTRQAGIKTLSRERHVGFGTLSAAIKTRIPKAVFDRIALNHKRTSHGDDLLGVRVWKQGGVKRRFIKVRNEPFGGISNWMPLSRWLWEREHGPVPEGSYVGFKDGNAMNDSLDNLHLLNRVETARVAVSKCDGVKRGAKISRSRKEQSEIRKRIEQIRGEKMVADAYGDSEWQDEETA